MIFKQICLCIVRTDMHVCLSLGTSAQISHMNHKRNTHVILQIYIVLDNYNYWITCMYHTFEIKWSIKDFALPVWLKPLSNIKEIGIYVGFYEIYEEVCITPTERLFS